MSRYPYLLDEFLYYFETPFENTDPNFAQCDIHRPPGEDASDRLYLVNHNLQVEIFGIHIPFRLRAGRTNAATGPGSIGAHVDLCTSIHGRKPDVVLLDFINIGEAMRAQDMINGF
jgi:hypothetical protein